jgi:tRNA (guanine-N7-)-methyltransferase
MEFTELTHKYPFPEKRPRHHVAPYLYIPFNKLKVIPDNYPKPISEISWSDVFINGNKPDFLDIGSGRGKFLIEFAIEHPLQNILGIEIRKYCVDWLIEVIKGERIENAGILWYNVLNGLNFIENFSLEAIFYLFPDPWPKARHLKRRAMNLELLSELYLKLRTGGKIYFATDLFEIHEYHIELLQSSSNFEMEILTDNFDWGLPKTNKELSCLRCGIPYYRIIATKK